MAAYLAPRVLSGGMCVYYEAEDGSEVNVAGLGYALMKGCLSAEDIEPAERGVRIRGECYVKRVE